MVRPTPASRSASGTSSKAIAANSTPPPNDVTRAAVRSGSVNTAAATAPATRLAPTSAPQPSEAARFSTLRARRDLRAQPHQRVEEDLRERGEGLDHVLHHVQRHPGADGDGRLLEPFARLLPERVRAGEPLAVRDERHEARALRV